MDDVRFARAIELRDQGKNEDALRELEALAKATLHPDERASLVMNQSTCLARLGRITEARQRWCEAASTSTARPYVDFIDACLYVSEGKTEEAMRRLSAFLRNHVDLKSIDPDTYSDAEERLSRLLDAMKLFTDAAGPQ